jgi:hypothetical protein
MRETKTANTQSDGADEIEAAEEAGIIAEAIYLGFKAVADANAAGLDRIAAANATGFDRIAAAIEFHGRITAGADDTVSGPGGRSYLDGTLMDG